jgi:hypothetical protein
MKSAIGGTIAAILLFVVAAACWSQARVARQVGEAHRRLATLHYDAEDGLDDAQTIWNRLPWPGTSDEDIQRQRNTVAYWRAQYASLTDLSLVEGADALTDPKRLLTAANASFRSAIPDGGDRKAAINRLDLVIQSYADVLRRDANSVEAAYNYEYVSRLRDTLAKAPPPRPGAARDRERVPAAKPENVSVDLPAGNTIHGRPGGPPEETDMSDFKTISPMRYDEREEQTDPGRGKELRRKG